jgi:CRISPR-associated protein Csb3
MGVATIPVDLFNPGQVFACLGFLEAADVLLGEAQGGFDWSDEADVRFVLRAGGDANPVAAVLGFLVEARLFRCGPKGYRDPPPKESKPRSGSSPGSEEAGSVADHVPLLTAGEFPSGVGDRMTLPIRLAAVDSGCVELGHWADGSSRESFKLYAGNRSAAGIAAAMLQGHVDKQGRTVQRGIAQLWADRRSDLLQRPFDVLTPMRGSFNFDPRGNWTAIDAGYSLNDQSHEIAASPVVQVLAAWGLENARPAEYALRKLRYAAWGIELCPMLARAALTAAISSIPSRRFRFDLALSGKNKVVNFAKQENTYD